MCSYTTYIETLIRFNFPHEMAIGQPAFHGRFARQACAKLLVAKREDLEATTPNVRLIELVNVGYTNVIYLIYIYI